MCPVVNDLTAKLEANGLPVSVGVLTQIRVRNTGIGVNEIAPFSHFFVDIVYGRRVIQIRIADVEMPCVVLDGLSHPALTLLSVTSPCRRWRAPSHLGSLSITYGQIGRAHV